MPATNPGACKQRTDCENDASGCLTRPLSIVKGGVGMNLISSMMVIVGASVEKYCWQSVIKGYPECCSATRCRGGEGVCPKGLNFFTFFTIFSPKCNLAVV